MMRSGKMGFFTVLMAEDDADDRFLVEEAILQLGGGVDLRFVEDGEELTHYLRRSGKYADPLLCPRPSLILLDLNMPKKDGRKALLELKADPELKAIPVVIWTTSREREDRIHCQRAGAEAYVTKPENYSELLNSVKKLVKNSVAGKTPLTRCRLDLTHFQWPPAWTATHVDLTSYD